jgi:hypothetical protein
VLGPCVTPVRESDVPSSRTGMHHSASGLLGVLQPCGNVADCAQQALGVRCVMRRKKVAQRTEMTSCRVVFVVTFCCLYCITVGVTAAPRFLTPSYRKRGSRLEAVHAIARLPQPALFGPSVGPTPFNPYWTSLRLLPNIGAGLAQSVALPSNVHRTGSRAHSASYWGDDRAPTRR